MFQAAVGAASPSEEFRVKSEELSDTGRADAREGATVGQKSLSVNS